MQQSLSRCIDFDLRHCPPEAIYGIMHPLIDLLRETFTHLAGTECDDWAWEAAQLPGPLGGCTFRVPSVLRAAAAYWAAWRSCKQGLQELLDEKQMWYNTQAYDEAARWCQQRLYEAVSSSAISV